MGKPDPRRNSLDGNRSYKQYDTTSGKRSQETELHVAAKRREIKPMTSLLYRGANISLKDGLGRMVDLRTRNDGQEEVLEFLDKRSSGRQLGSLFSW